MPDRVCAVVVTHNRKDVLRRCLRALEAQTRPIDQVLVVDNASTDATRDVLAQDFVGVRVLALPNNVGGAGGFAAGMEWALAHDFEWVWVMDDDAFAAPDCLQKLWEQRRSGSVIVPIQQDSAGCPYGIFEWSGRARNVTSEVLAGTRAPVGDYLFAFVGPLFSRQVIEMVGLPCREFFIWFDDWEYALRIHRASARIMVVPEAVLLHDFGKPKQIRFLWQVRRRNEVEPWKCYYRTRNPLHVLLRSGRPRSELARFVAAELQHLIGDMLYEARRSEYLAMHLKAIVDGLSGRLGARVLPPRRVAVSPGSPVLEQVAAARR